MRMDLEIILQSEVSQKEKDNYHTLSLEVQSKIWHKWTKQRQTPRQKTKGKRGGEK